MRGDETGLKTRPSLLVRIRDAGDDAAWVTFVTIYGPLVYRYACRRGVQDADAADVTQDVMNKVAGTIRSFEYRPDRGRFRDWLLTITRHRVAQFYKCRAQSPEQPFRSGELEKLGGGDDPPDADWNEAFNARVLRVALDRVRPHYEAVTWCAFEQV
jgi:RNA polymerase sigma factor (sigma-70 family)